jgi:chitodextrinase
MKKQNVMGAGQIKVLCAFSAACTFAFPSLTLAEVGLVAAYTFNEGSGTTVADVSGNNNTGALGSGITWSAQGKFGNALTFNGAGSVTVPHAASLNLTTGMTLEAWVFPTTASTSDRSPTVVLKEYVDGQLSVYGFGTGPSPDGPADAFYGPDAFFMDTTGIPRGINAPPNLPLNAWSHLAATYDAATSILSVYVNGVLRTSQGLSDGSITTSIGPVRIGGNNVLPGAFFQSLIDEVRIYNRALSQSEIQTDMNTPVAPPVPDTTSPTATTGLTATVTSTSQIDLAWSAATDNVGVTGYRVERCQGVGCTIFAQVATSSGTSFSDTGLTPATSYGYRVRAADAAGNLGAYSNIRSATPPATDTTPPTAPAGLTATAVTSSQVNLSWTPSTDNLGVTSYQVERCQGAGCTTFSQIATPSQTSYSNFGLTAATSYSYRVRAVDAAGNLGPYSVVSVTTQAADTTPPTAPSGLTATAVNGKRIDLNWTASTDNVGVNVYNLERCQGASCTNFAQIRSPVPASFIDDTVSAGNTYRYRVRAADGSANLGAYSNIASATTPIDTTPPTAPSGLTATAVNSSQINLTWTASTDNLGVDIYEVYRCQGASCTNFVLVSSPRVTSAIDTGLAAATTYRYKVRAKDVALNPSAYSSILSVTTQATDTTPPSVPSGLTGSVTSSQVNLSWTASTDNVAVTGYRIERCQGASCSTFAQIGTSTIVSFSDTGVTAATSYSYRVRAADAAGNLSVYSNIISVTIQAADTTAPTAPTGLAATAASASQINLTWTASTDDVGVTGYQVDRCQGAGCTTFAQVATSTGTSFNDTGLAPSTSYSYQVRAADAAGNISANSSIATATTQAPPDTTAPTAPTGLSATAVSTTQINLAWTASTDNVAVTGYRVERCQGTGCTNFVEIAAPTATSFNDMNIATATNYAYRVRASDAAGNLSAYSNVVSAMANAVFLTVTSPAAGAVIASDTVTVSGTFSGPSNTGIAVNGVVAVIIGDTFVASSVPLQAGANTLTVTLTTPNNQTATQTLSLSSTGPALIEVLASPTHGVAPLPVTFTINNRTGNAIQSVQANYSGAGSFASVDPRTLSNSYTASGIYQATFIITDSTGATYQQTVPISVQDTAQIDQMLQTAWWGFTTALAAGDTTQALQYFNTQAQQKFQSVFQTLATDLPQIVGSFSPPQLVSVTDQMGEYAINRTINGVEQIFFIYFIRDVDGVWRIDDM